MPWNLLKFIIGKIKAAQNEKQTKNYSLVHETWQRNASLEYLFQRQRLKLGGVSQQFNRIYINVTTLI